MFNLNLEYWVHWLSFGFKLNDVKAFETFLALCKKNGVAGVELPWKPLMELTATEVANSLKKFGITKIALYIFFSDIDPLDRSTGRRAALAHITNAMRFINVLRSLGIETVCIDGPFAYQIEKEYRGGTTKPMLAFLRAVSKLAAHHQVLCCIQSLRLEENQAIGDGASTVLLVEWVDSHWIKAHLGTFHMDCWGEDMGEVLSRAGSNLGWFHVSGRNRYTPGSKGDRIDWKIVAEALLRNRVDASDEPVPGVCFKALSPAFRKGNPAIGAGFPKDLKPEKAISTARQTLRYAKIIA